MSGSSEINIGFIVEGNAYFGAFNRYLAMPKPELESEIQRLQSIRRNTYSRFVKHRTVPIFAISCAMLILAIIAMPPGQPSAFWVVLVSLWSAFGIMPTAIWMKCERAPIFDALRLLKREISMAKAALATK